MKLVQKLLVLLIVGISLVLTANGYFRVRREVALFESDRVRNHDVTGRTLATAIGAVWRLQGKAEALATIQAVDQRTQQLTIRWVPGGSALPDSPRERCAHTKVAGVASSEGTLALCESLDIRDAYVRRTVLETVITSAVLIAVCAAIAALVGIFLVGRPVKALVGKAQRIGAGDFDDDLRLRGSDELAGLASEMNRTCGRLREAALRIERETSSRISALEQLRHADRLMTVGKLASGIAHELGTPMNVIEARAEMIASGETTSAEASSYAQVIMEASQRMTRILRQLLDFARMRGASKGPCDVCAIAERTVKLLGPVAAKANVTLSADGDPAVALVDAAQIEQVLANLVVNGIHAMRAPGAVEVRVAVATAVAPADLGGDGTSAEWVRATVRDEGIGIDERDLPHVFEPFFTTKDVGEGTGLGLAVAYGIVRDHEGWIDVETKKGTGTTFAIYLPRAPR